MPGGTSAHVCDFCVALCLFADTSRLKQRSQVQYQECRHQVCRNQHQRQLGMSVRLTTMPQEHRPQRYTSPPDQTAAPEVCSVI